jgi:hypothetical protein
MAVSRFHVPHLGARLEHALTTPAGVTSVDPDWL